MTATLLANFCAIKKKSGGVVHVYSPLKEVSRKIQQLGFPIDATFEATDVTASFSKIAASIYTRYIVVLVDGNIFEDGKRTRDPVVTAMLAKDEAKTFSGISELMMDRVHGYITELRTPRAQAVYGLPDFRESAYPSYIAYASGIVNYMTNLGFTTRQITAKALPVNFTLFFGIEEMRGFEVKTDMRTLDTMCDILKIAPLYNLYISVVCNVIENSAPNIAPAFYHLLFFKVPEGKMRPFRMSEYWPDKVLDISWVYTNRTLPNNMCFKLKFPSIIEEE
jgi:hypothetical protein